MLACGGVHAWAQSATAIVAAVSASPTGAALDEVVVTARRRAETLEKVPVSVTALGAAQIQQRL